MKGSFNKENYPRIFIAKNNCFVEASLCFGMELLVLALHVRGPRFNHKKEKKFARMYNRPSYQNPYPPKKGHRLTKLFCQEPYQGPISLTFNDSR